MSAPPIFGSYRVYLIDRLSARDLQSATPIMGAPVWTSDDDCEG